MNESDRFLVALAQDIFRRGQAASLEAFAADTYPFHPRDTYPFRLRGGNPVNTLVADPNAPRYAIDDGLFRTAESLRDGTEPRGTEAVSRTVYLHYFPEHADLIGDADFVVVHGTRRFAAARAAGIDLSDAVVVLDDLPPAYRPRGGNPVNTSTNEVP